MVLRNLFNKSSNPPNKSDANAPSGDEPIDQPEPKYQHPKILLVDLDESVGTALQDKGYNVAAGSLGKPYRVSKKNEFYPVDRTLYLPDDYTEQQIVIIDLFYNLDNDQVIEESVDVAPHVSVLAANHEQGFVNPRLINGLSLQSDFDRILNSGGVFIILSHKIEAQQFYEGYYSHGFNISERHRKLNNWEFLSVTGYSLAHTNDPGQAIDLADDLPKEAPIRKLLAKHMDDAMFTCVFEPRYDIEEEWVNLLKNVHGDKVGAVITPSKNGDRKGYAFILPIIRDKAAFIVDLIDQHLPVFVPKLFPDSEQASWVHQPVYELAEVAALQTEIERIQAEARVQIEKREAAIQQLYEDNAYLYDLARQTGEPLVQAVQTAFYKLGFKQVIDVDQQLADQGDKGTNREDLQILDDETSLVVEVKGINNFPNDDDSLVVQKYVILRMRDWNHTNVQGVTIINHQRHLPPFDRDNKKPYRQELLDVAKEQQICLVTGWDLHRLVRSYLHNNWQHHHIRPLFYQSGRFEVVPIHYEYIGKIERFIEGKGVVGIRINEAELKEGDQIAFELPIVFEEQRCQSLQHENESIVIAQKGMLVGLKTHLSQTQAKKGTRVFRLKAELSRGV